MTIGTDFILEWLRNRQPIDVPVALVAAHPDDETIGAGASLHLFRNLLLIYLTDGAPRDLRDAGRSGFAAAADYAAARFRELDAALTVSGAAARVVRLDAPDQRASLCMNDLIGRLRSMLSVFRARYVMTHPYEGGHPDHDAASFIVRRACSSAAILEFTSYHAGCTGDRVSGTFLPGSQPTVVPLISAEQDRKRAMLACFTSQQPTLSSFGVGHEAFRPAPAYDFRLPPHPGPLLYEQFDCGMTGARWRELAMQAGGG